MAAMLHAPHDPEALAAVRPHPKGSRAHVLLSSVFGPYARDDAYGSRALNPMELYHNQVTRVQRAFSVRAHHRSFGLMLIQANIKARCALLDFPSRERFVQELRRTRYDIVGIGSIVMNVDKVEEMCRLVRQHLPDAVIVIGGHVANLPGIETRVDADHVVRGEGVRWMRTFLGEDPAAPLEHPKVTAGFNVRAMGLPVRRGRSDQPAVLMPSVGCPMGCNFCSTSAMFGGKGRFVDFYPTGDDLFDVMRDLESSMQARSFFVMDENFLLHRRRALRLLELMEHHDKAWALHVFSSAKVLRSYTTEQLVGLGLAWVWLGIEGEDSHYAKVQGVDTRDLVRSLQDHGTSVLGSTIIGLESHTPGNIDEAIDYAVSHDTEFHQFMLYTAVPGTPLHAELRDAGALLDPADCPHADAHGQLRFNFRHPNIPAGEETSLLLRAFQRDFIVNGPSVLRMARTVLRGWQRYKDHPDRRIRRRFAWQARELPVMFAGALWAARRWLRPDPALAARLSSALEDIQREFGWRSRLAAPLAGSLIRWTLAREERRLARGWTYEPPTILEHNAAALEAS